MSASIFNYNTLNTKLAKETRTLYITLNNPKTNNAIDFEMLFELESILAWATSHVEIGSIFIDSSQSFLSNGIDLDWLKKADVSKLKRLTRKLKIINQALCHLPQTIVMDLGSGAFNLAAEFFLAADIRIAATDTGLSFNHAQIGLIPSAGGISLLKELVGSARSAHWLKTTEIVKANELLASGLVYKTYEPSTRQKIISEILINLHTQAPVSRIQTKLSLFETYRKELDKNLIFDQKTFNAALTTEDWKHIDPEQMQSKEMMRAKDFKTAVKLSLIKGGRSRDPEANH